MMMPMMRPRTVSSLRMLLRSTRSLEAENSVKLPAGSRSVTRKPVATVIEHCHACAPAHSLKALPNVDDRQCEPAAGISRYSRAPADQSVGGKFQTIHSGVGSPGGAHLAAFDHRHNSRNHFRRLVALSCAQSRINGERVDPGGRALNHHLSYRIEGFAVARRDDPAKQHRSNSWLRRRIDRVWARR